MAALSVFGGDKVIFALSAPFFLQLLVYNDHTAFKVNAIPQQSQYLALAHTGEECEHIDGFIAVSTGYFQKSGDCFIIQRMNVFANSPRQITGVGWICADMSQLYSLLHRFVKNSVDIANAFRRQWLSVSTLYLQRVIKPLHILCFQGVQFHCSKSGL